MRIRFLLLLIVPILAQAESESGPLVSFETDLCTLWPEGTIKNPKRWAHCCVMHDLHYWVGGSQKDMNEADHNLRMCVTEAYNRRMADLMYFGIRTGQYSPIKLKGKGWGYAWPKTRPRKLALSKDEMIMAVDEIYYHHPEVEIIMVDAFVEQLKNRQN